MYALADDGRLFEVAIAFTEPHPVGLVSGHIGDEPVTLLGGIDRWALFDSRWTARPVVGDRQAQAFERLHQAQPDHGPYIIAPRIRGEVATSPNRPTNEQDSTHFPQRQTNNSTNVDHPHRTDEIGDLR